MAKAKSKTEEVKDTIRTSQGLRDTLFETYDGLRRGKITPQAAREHCRIASAILSVVRLEIDAAKFVSAAKVAGKVGEVAQIPVLNM